MNYRVIDFHTNIESRRIWFCKTQKEALERAKYICDMRKFFGRKPQIKYHKLLKTYVVYSKGVRI